MFSQRQPSPGMPVPQGGYTEQFRMQETQFQQQPVNRSVSFPDADQYEPQEDLTTDGQPLLRTDRPPVSFAPQTSPGPRYGTPRGREPRRYKTTRKVELLKGNLVFDCSVPTKYLNAVPRRDEKEFTQMRYTAATCDPSDFLKEGYTLRQVLMGRQTELFIVLTMYNEDEVLFTRSMHGVMKNIAHLCTRDRSRTWGPNGWQKIVVCIVSDGRKKIHPRVLSVLAAMGVYQDGVAKSVLEDKPITAHIYEYTTQISIDPEMKFKGADKDIVPVQILFCLKEKNAKKINSHRWFFSAFGSVLNPNICILIDVGTRPGNTSLYHLWKAFDLNSNVAGACGEIRALTGTAGVNLLNPLVATQNFEYKMSNILDKPLESVFGYISVLPGAFSAYRYLALQGQPLQKYFLGETQHGGDADIFTANMYLAEDRILCFELVAKQDCSWVLHYVSSAFGETDVPDSVPELVSQRRRWLNGSFFAGVYALYHFPKMWKSGHSTWRKVALLIENIYMTYNLIFQWLALGNFYLTFFILTESLAETNSPPFPKEIASLLHELLRYVYIMLIVVQFIMAMGNRPQGAKWSYTAIMIFYAFLMAYMLFAAIWLTKVGVQLALDNASGAGISKAFVLLSDGPFRDIIISLSSTYLMYFVASFLFFDPWHMFTSFGQYLFLMPSYTNVLNIYAFCNTHDVSWGTKGDTSVATDLGVIKGVKKDANGAHTVEIAVPTEQTDINAAYDEACADLHKHVPEPVQNVDAKTAQEDYYKIFRTKFVIAWILSNALLVVVITNPAIFLRLGNIDQRSNAYFSFILWSVAALSAFRFCGSCLYLVFRVFTG